MEARLIRAHSPPCNRAQRGRAAKWWLRLSSELFPRLVSSRTEGGLGPLSSGTASVVREALEEAADIRTCTPRITVRTRFASCVRGQIGRCPAPCDGAIEPATYAPIVGPVAAALTGDPSEIIEILAERIEHLSAVALVEAVRGLRAVRAIAARIEIAIGNVRTAIHRGFLVLEPDKPAADGHPDEPRLVAAWLWRNRARIQIQACDGEVASAIAGGSALAAWAERLRRLRLVEDGRAAGR